MHKRASETDLELVRDALARGDGNGAADAISRLRSEFPGDPELARLEAQSAFARGDSAVALRRLLQSLALDARHGASWQDLGMLYLNLSQPDQALQAYRRALTVDLRAAGAWAGAGAAFDLLGQTSEALAAFREALSLTPDDPHTRLHYAAALLAASDLASAEREARKVAVARPDDPNAAFVLGNVLAAAGRHEDAVDAFQRAATSGPDRAEAEFNLAISLDELGRLHAAARACERSLALAPHLDQVLAQLVFLKRRLCEWHGLAELSARLRDAVRRGAPGVTPFSFLAEQASPAEQLRCARRQAQLVLDATHALRRRTVFPQRGVGARLRVGFVSSGFNNHPTALLLVEVLEHLRNGALTTVGFATTPGDGGALRDRVRNAFSEFHDVSGLMPGAIAGRIYDARIDILLDLRGHGAGGVGEVFALRPAPVQAAWFAYPGTSGAPYIDYLLADRYVVPESQRAHYSESIAWLPHCFQPSDSTRAVLPPPSRPQCGLPDRGIVFASFNNSYKIAPDTFACWMKVLRETPDSVLWLLAGRDEEHTTENLRAHARAAGVEPERLVFMPKLAHDQYLTRYAHADLFLDTWPYDAHTTASDALWAGCPVLTLPGETFASRVAGSLLTTLGMTEMIARDEHDYVAKALVVARSPETRERLRTKLARARGESPLFDMRRLATALEDALRAMGERARFAQPPADITVEDRR